MGNTEKCESLDRSLSRIDPKNFREVYNGHQVINRNTSAVQYFHMICPNTQVELYLYGALFPKMFYTEMGGHTHQQYLPGTHSHKGSTNPGSRHRHSFKMTDNDDEEDYGKYKNKNTGWEDSHTHTFSISESGDHDHKLLIFGNESIKATSRNIQPINGLEIWINGENFTDKLLEQSKLTEFGNGTAKHVFNTEGSGRLDIGKLLKDDGEHKIEFKQPPGKVAGGIIRWNIYIYPFFHN